MVRLADLLGADDPEDIAQEAVSDSWQGGFPGQAGSGTPAASLRNAVSVAEPGAAQ